MKKVLYAACTLLIITIMTVSFASCEKDEGKLPNISFKTGTGYTTANATVGQNAAVLIGINASKSENKDVLTKFTITKNNNTVYTKDLDGAEGDNFAYDYSFNTDSSAHTEAYTFTVVNKDGLTNSVSLTLTVN